MVHIKKKKSKNKKDTITREPLQVHVYIHTSLLCHDSYIPGVCVARDKEWRVHRGNHSRQVALLEKKNATWLEWHLKIDAGYYV